MRLWAAVPRFRITAGLFFVSGMACFALTAQAADMSTLRLDGGDGYHFGRQADAPQGVIDPYSGELLEPGAFTEGFGAPQKSFAYEQQGTAATAGLSYTITRGVTLNLDPVEQRFHSDLNLGGKEKKRFKLRLNSKQVKVMFVYRY